VQFPPNLTIAKTADAQTVPAGSPVGFTVTVGNSGRGATARVTLTDPLPTRAGIAWSISPATQGCSIASDTLTCDYGSIEGGGTRTVHVTSPTTTASCGALDNTATAQEIQIDSRFWAGARATVTASAASTVACAGITLDKTGPAVVHHGEPLPFSFAVANAGGDALGNVVVTDDHCTVGASTTSRSNDDGDALLEAKGADGATSEVWVFTCTASVPAHAAGEPNPIHNIATVTAVAGQAEGRARAQTVTATDSHDTLIVHPAVHIEKTGPARATAGDTVKYVLAVTNPGDILLVGQTLAVTDARCDAPPALRDKGGDQSPDDFNAGDTWTYTCSVKSGASASRIDNTGTVVGFDPFGVRVTDDDPAVTLLEAGGVEPSQVSGGRARLHGPAGCVKRPFAVRITGRHIRRVVIRVDGRKVASRARGGRFRIHPSRFGAGIHRLRARVAFRASSRTGPRTLRMAFERCRRQVIAPQFTG
jgi:uncharacterized repeat protein (TIGR01451 family)